MGQYFVEVWKSVGMEEHRRQGKSVLELVPFRLMPLRSEVHCQ